MISKRLTLLLVLLIALCGASWAQSKRNEGANVRSVQGTVTDASGNSVAGAVVQLKNTKTLQIRSFITKEHGDYYFSGLSSDVEYELRAESHGTSSSKRSLSPFDSRKEAVINLKLDQKGQ